MGNILYSAPTSWADAFAAADFNALASGGGILSTATAVDNATGKYLFADLSFSMVTSTVSPAVGAHLLFFVIPLLHDSNYADNENTTTAANLPASTLARATIGFRTKTSQSIKGAAWRIPIPPGQFKWYVVNRLGVVLPSSATNMTCQHRFYGYNAA
jgi:hypothetical protein